MAEHSDFDIELIRENLSATRERLRRKQLAPAPDPAQDPRAQAKHYRTYRDALIAAGLASALGEPEEEIKELLATAARAALQVFRLRGTLAGHITHLAEEKEGREEVFVDESLTNPLHHTQAIYAALAARLQEELQALSSINPDKYQTDQVEVSPVLDRYNRILVRVLGSKSPASIQDELQQLISQHRHTPDPHDQYWLAQAAVLQSILQSDPHATQTTLAHLKETLANYYAGPHHRNSPERFLQLPLRALNALAEKLQVPKH
ncbi:MAG TPA: Imm49 family immunity protein [Pyrinomonadaceae bacterium]|jgi:hypothetical protein